MKTSIFRRGLIARCLLPPTRMFLLADEDERTGRNRKNLMPFRTQNRDHLGIRKR